MDADTDNLLRGIIVVVLLFAFLGMVAWAYSKNRKKDFEQMGNLPLDDDDKSLIEDAQLKEAQTTKTKERK